MTCFLPYCFCSVYFSLMGLLKLTQSILPQRNMMPDTLGSEEEHGSCVIFLLDTSNRKTSLAGDRKGGEEKYEKEEVEEEEKENEKEEKRI